MTALIIYAAYHRRDTLSRGQALTLIVGGGVIFPTTVLTLLLWHGLTLLPKLLTPAPHGSLKIYVSGEQWWWRVRYLPTHGAPIELANEIRLPVGEPVDFLLESPDVIHSFWIPALGGKMDMIPGRQNRLTLQATVTGRFRGVCAEYCGTSHAWMEFPVIVLEKADFTRWLKGQTLPSQTPENPLAQHGRDLFLHYGCGACHTIRGTEADGIIGIVTRNNTISKAITRGEIISRHGIPEKKVPACARCHEVEVSLRSPIYPRLAGQYADYLMLQLNLLKKNQRGGTDFNHLMQPIATRMTDAQIRDVAFYYSSRK